MKWGASVPMRGMGCSSILDSSMYYQMLRFTFMYLINFGYRDHEIF